jgi:2-polyprenyl-3-methyl-5-hydroxy-6-metoxy-1,4-benzoquinol methylase
VTYVVRRACPCCQTQDRPKPFHRSSYVACGACHALLSTVPASDYETNYYYHSDDFASIERRRSQLCWQFLTRTVDAIPFEQRPDLRSAQVLEVGCSRGYFVEECLRHRLSIHGIDVSAKAIHAAGERGLGERCRCADAQSLDGRSESNDIVIAWELLEHFDDPTDFLTSVRRQLRPGGWFIGSTPNGDSSWLRVLRDGWHGCSIPQYHRIYFSAQGLRSSFHRQGFGNVLTLTCCNWRESLLLKNVASVLARRYLRTEHIAVRALVAASIGLPEKLAEVGGGRLPSLRGDTLLFAARAAP